MTNDSDSVQVAALRASEQQLRSFFEQAVEGMFQTTPDGRYLQANPALARIYGYDLPDQLLDELTDIAQQLYVSPNRRAVFTQLLEANDQVSDFEFADFPARRQHPLDRRARPRGPRCQRPGALL